MCCYTKVEVKILCALLLVGCCVIGCKKNEPAPETPVSTVGPAPGPPGASGGIAPMTMAPMAIAPVSGTESLQGGGSGVGGVMKERARDIAATGGASSVNQMPPDDDGGG